MTEWRKDSELHELFKYPEGLVRLPATRKELTPTGLCRYSILPEEEKGKELPELNCFENRAVGVLMGLVVIEYFMLWVVLSTLCATI
eukprot:m.83465 g.83465  ORF g.83465 m.83465 type:complete len:87 (-) comp14345_c1_seq2:1560-1820(-)